MDTTIIRNWFSKRIKIADDVANRYGKSGEPDAEIILCCTTSALAATMWPGQKIDRKRFIEFLIEFAPQQTNIRRISICLLISKFQANGKFDLAYRLIDYRFPSRLAYFAKSPETYTNGDEVLYAGTLPSIIDPDTIDLEESEAISVIPEVEIREIRQSSYASIIYTDLRSGLVHEYELTSNLASSGWHHKNDLVSYLNFINMPDETQVVEMARKFEISVDESRSALTTVERRLHFPYSYIRDLVKRTADAAFAYWESVSEFARTEPSSWWISG